MTGDGLVFYVSDGTRHYTLTDGSADFLNAGQNHHVAFVWRLFGDDTEVALAVYIDNKLSSTFEVEGLYRANFKPNPNAVLVLGGHAWDGITATRISSVDGVVDNLRVYNYTINDFSYNLEHEGMQYVRPGDELIAISTDGINFYGSECRGDELPLLMRNVAPGEWFNVYVRNKDNLADVSLRGQDRISYIEVKKTKAG
jgi:hypothetical protein